VITMPALAQLLDGDQAAALCRLQVKLITEPPPPAPAEPTAAVCRECGRPMPAPVAVFRAPAERGGSA
jgi:hypothetical protein